MGQYHAVRPARVCRMLIVHYCQCESVACGIDSHDGDGPCDATATHMISTGYGTYYVCSACGSMYVENGYGWDMRPC